MFWINKGFWPGLTIVLVASSCQGSSQLASFCSLRVRKWPRALLANSKFKLKECNKVCWEVMIYLMKFLDGINIWMCYRLGSLEWLGGDKLILRCLSWQNWQLVHIPTYRIFSICAKKSLLLPICRPQLSCVSITSLWGSFTTLRQRSRKLLALRWTSKIIPTLKSRSPV